MTMKTNENKSVKGDTPAQQRTSVVVAHHLLSKQFNFNGFQCRLCVSDVKELKQEIYIQKN